MTKGTCAYIRLPSPLTAKVGCVMGEGARVAGCVFCNAKIRTFTNLGALGLRLLVRCHGRLTQTGASIVCAIDADGHRLEGETQPFIHRHLRYDE